MNIEKLFEFIKERRGYDYPLRYKLLKGIELTEGDLTVNGDLDLTNSKLSSLPDNLRVKGDMWLDYSDRIFSLPDNLHVGSWLDLDYSLVEEIPNNLKVGDFLSIHSTPLLRINRYIDRIKHIIKDKGGYLGGVIFT
jgi:hypothetical protein